MGIQTKVIEIYCGETINGVIVNEKLITSSHEYVFTCSYNQNVSPEQATGFADSTSAIIGTIANIELSSKKLNGLLIAKKCQFLKYSDLYRTCEVCSPVFRPYTSEEEVELEKIVGKLLRLGKVEVINITDRIQVWTPVSKEVKDFKCLQCKAEYLGRDVERSIYHTGYDMVRYPYAKQGQRV